MEDGRTLRDGLSSADADQAASRLAHSASIPCANTDRELWREREGDYYAPSIFVTKHGAIGINVGGTVIVRALAEWHALASRASVNSCVGGGTPSVCSQCGASGVDLANGLCFECTPDGFWPCFSASRIEARSDETPQAAQPEGREPDPKGDAHV
jgi:hypothetical protein